MALSPTDQTRQAVLAWQQAVHTTWNRLQPVGPSGEPVVIVGGLLAPGATYDVLADRLRAQGYQVYIFPLPTLGTQDMAASAKALAAFVGQVRAETGSAKVNLVGHSEGGVVAREFIKFDGGGDQVDNLVTLGSPSHGAYLANGLNAIGGSLTPQAIQEFQPGSPFLTSLNGGSETPDGVHYTTFRTEFDEAVRPVDSAMLAGANNVLVQDQLPFDPVGHVGLVFDPNVADGVVQALRHQPINLTK